MNTYEAPFFLNIEKKHLEFDIGSDFSVVVMK
jgi:hypothetical protein